MLSDEEKKAVEILNKWLCKTHSEFCKAGAVGIPNEEFFATEIVLNLIEKQSKEIEELKNADLTTVYLNGFYDGQKSVENKIKAKIEDIESQINDIKSNLDYEYDETMVNEVWRLENKIDVLQSLLEKE